MAHPEIHIQIFSYAGLSAGNIGIVVPNPGTLLHILSNLWLRPQNWVGMIRLGF